MAKVIVANACHMPDTDYFFSGYSSYGGIVYLSRYFEEAVIFNDDDLARLALHDCELDFQLEGVCFRLEEVET